jgi:tetratricopeptide (TPR) repeat protein
LVRDPKSETARRFLAVALLELDDRPAAERELETLVHTAYATPAEAFDGLLQSLGELANEVGVAAVMADLASRFPDVAEAHYAAGATALAASDSPTARAEGARALALRPGWREARWLVARAEVVGGQCETGLGDAGTLAAEGRDADRLVYAWLLVACGRAEAEPYFTKLSKIGNLKSEALEGLASIDIDAGRWDEAIARDSELVGAGRNAERGYYGLGVVADRRRQFGLAVRLYRRVTTGSRAAAAQLRAYRLLLEHGVPGLADAELDEFVTQSTENRITVTAGRAEVLAERGQGGEAMALLDRAARSYPDQVELRYARAAVLERLGRVDAAVTVLRDVRRERPLDPTAANALGFTLADHAMNLDEAERLIRSALAARPDSAAIKDSLGWVLYRRGRATEALPWLQAAVGADPEPEIQWHLGEVQWALGQHEAAIGTWRAGLAHAPDDRRLTEALVAHPAG